jgi:hypothetical protein
MFYTIILNFKKQTAALLLIFVNFVVKQMKGNPTYLDLALQVDTVESANTVFSDALTAAGTGDYNNVTVMRQKRKLLEDEVTVLARMLELTRNPDITFYTYPGFEVRRKPTRNLMPLNKPVIKFLKQGVLSGSLDGEVVDYPEGVTQLALQYSLDGGISWNNGSYSSGKRFSLANLTARNSFLVRACYHGSNKRMSDWSEPMALFVL